MRKLNNQELLRIDSKGGFYTNQSQTQISIPSLHVKPTLAIHASSWAKVRKCATNAIKELEMQNDFGKLKAMWPILNPRLCRTLRRTSEHDALASEIKWTWTCEMSILNTHVTMRLNLFHFWSFSLIHMQNNLSLDLNQCNAISGKSLEVDSILIILKKMVVGCIIIIILKVHNPVVKFH